MTYDFEVNKRDELYHYQLIAEAALNYVDAKTMSNFGPIPKGTIRKRYDELIAAIDEYEVWANE